MMTAQEIFDKVARHLLTQGEPATCPSTKACSFRGTEGRMCAVGCLIPDEAYDTTMEDLSFVKHAPLKKALEDAGVDVDQHQELLSHMMRIHDGVAPNLWQAALWTYTVYNNLTDHAIYGTPPPKGTPPLFRAGPLNPGFSPEA